jgi:rare lipoprotein A (peptidoglycan hydrolase)
LLISPIFAQVNSFFQRGKAVQEINSDGLTAGHPSLPINSKATVINTLTGKEVEVTIVRRVPASANRIVDLSAGAWQALGVNADTDVIVSTSPPPRPRPAIAQAEEEPEDPPPPPPPPPDPPAEIAEEPRDDGGDPSQPINITVNAYLTPEERQKYSETMGYRHDNESFLAWLASMMMIMNQDIRDARDVRDIRDARETRDVRDARDERSSSSASGSSQPQVLQITQNAQPYQGGAQPGTVVTQTPKTDNAHSHHHHQSHVQPQPQPQPVQQPPPVQQQPVQPPPVQQQPARPAPENLSINPVNPPLPPTELGEIKIIPGLPNPNSNKIYHVQVGSFSAREAAARVEQQVRLAGFSAGTEFHNNYYRVLALNIPAPNVHNSILRLSTIGFREFWVREYYQIIDSR